MVQGESRLPPATPLLNEEGHLTDPVLDAMAMDIAAYFSECNAREKRVVLKDGSLISVPNPVPYTHSGLALAVKMSEEEMFECAKSDGAAGRLIQMALRKIKQQDEERLKAGEAALGMIFSMKNRHGWSDVDKEDRNAGGAIKIHLDVSDLRALGPAHKVLGAQALKLKDGAMEMKVEGGKATVLRSGKRVKK